MSSNFVNENPHNLQVGTQVDYEYLSTAASWMWAHFTKVWWSYVLAAGAVLVWGRWGSSPVYMLDFATFQPPASWQVSQADLVNIMKKIGTFTDESLEFMERILQRSGTGEKTHWPPGTVRLPVRAHLIGITAM